MSMHSMQALMRHFRLLQHHCHTQLCSTVVRHASSGRRPVHSRSAAAASARDLQLLTPGGMPADQQVWDAAAALCFAVGSTRQVSMQGAHHAGQTLSHTSTATQPQNNLVYLICMGAGHATRLLLLLLLCSSSSSMHSSLSQLAASRCPSRTWLARWGQGSCVPGQLRARAAPGQHSRA
jgi:hypothetical protein